MTRAKPRLRGVSHEIATYAAGFAGTYLVSQARGPGTTLIAMWAATAYSLTVFFQFGASALYHRPTWSPEARARLRRVDHSAIPLMIAGTATPPVALGLPPEQRTWALALIWAGAALGLAKSLFWTHAPKPVTALVFVIFGAALAGFLPLMSPAIVTPAVHRALVGGALLYALGALVYALRRPDPMPAVFGYHEIFHLCVVLAAGVHYWAMWQIVTAVARASGY
jgi:hemolysin III